MDACVGGMSNERMLRAALLDVGGTLWPERLPVRAGPDPCLEQLERILPGINAAPVLTALREELRKSDGSLVQDTHRLLAAAMRRLALHSAEQHVVAVRRAMCAPAVPGVRLFPGAADLLATFRQLGLRSVIVSNVQVRGALEYWRDFADLGVAQWVDVVVTSLDVGFRKPHPAFFEAAIRAAGCEPGACVMVGNSESYDIQPAIALGMRAIHVAIEEPPPATSAAHGMVTDLHAVARVVRQWMATRDESP